MPKSNAVLWLTQGFLALFFASASGAPKVLMPVDALPMPIPLSQQLVWFIGVCEVLGALGLVLPAVTRIRPDLVPVAAAALTLLTACATGYQLLAGQPGNAAFAAAMGLICAAVAFGRGRAAPRGGSAIVRSTAVWGA